MKIIIEKEITKELLENIFVTALEGGSNDWYWLTGKMSRHLALHYSGR
jgi:hypothetical protein